MAEFMAANNQWSRRPDDERFSSLEEMLSAASDQRKRMSEVTVEVGSLRFEADGDEGLVMGGLGKPTTLNNYAFEQMSRKLDYPPTGIVGKVNAAIAADILNYRVQKQEEPDKPVQLLVENGAVGVVHSVTSDRYARIWNDEPIPYLMSLEKHGWKVPPTRPYRDDQKGIRPARADEVGMWGKGGVQIREGDPIAPGNLYSGDRDMFVLMANPDRSTDDGGGNGLMRGLMCYNSQVGDRSFGLRTFTMQGVCGNAIIWGATEIMSVRYKHMGEVRDRMIKALEGIAVTDNGFDRELGIIAWMRKNKLGESKESVVDNVYSMRADPELTQKVIESAYDNAEQNREADGDPNTWYGLANAITRYSQRFPNMNDRFALDRAAGKLFDRAAKLVTV